jgi:hypothetical protein
MIQSVHAPNRTAVSCLASAPQNSTSKDFDFTLSGVPQQCATTPGLQIAMSGGVSDEPYNFTVVPLDQGFWAYDVALTVTVDSDELVSTTLYAMPLPAGSGFHVYLSVSGTGRPGA